MIDFKKGFPDAKKHARKMYPEEMCGFIIDGEFVPVDNVAIDPSEHKKDGECLCRLCHFKVRNSDSLKYLDKCQAIIHSHPNSPIYPSQADMEGQRRTAVPWGIINLDDERVSDPEMFGDELPIPDLLGRSFMHGIRDCYDAIRDTFRMGKDDLAASDITKQWPFAPITLKNVPRNDAWWESSDDFYGVLPFSYGWKEIERREARPGDVFLVKIRSDKFNHAGVLVAQDLILHHLPGRVSRREPAGLWGRQAGRWLRYIGEGSND